MNAVLSFCIEHADLAKHFVVVLVIGGLGFFFSNQVFGSDKSAALALKESLAGSLSDARSLHRRALCQFKNGRPLTAKYLFRERDLCLAHARVVRSELQKRMQQTAVV